MCGNRVTVAYRQHNTLEPCQESSKQSDLYRKYGDFAFRIKYSLMNVENERENEEEMLQINTIGGETRQRLKYIFQLAI